MAEFNLERDTQKQQEVGSDLDIVIVPEIEITGSGVYSPPTPVEESGGLSRKAFVSGLGLLLIGAAAEASGLTHFTEGLKSLFSSGEAPKSSAVDKSQYVTGTEEGGIGGGPVQINRNQALGETQRVVISRVDVEPQSVRFTPQETAGVPMQYQELKAGCDRQLLDIYTQTVAIAPFLNDLESVNNAVGGENGALAYLRTYAPQDAEVLGTFMAVKMAECVSLDQSQLAINLMFLATQLNPSPQITRIVTTNIEALNRVWLAEQEQMQVHGQSQSQNEMGIKGELAGEAQIQGETRRQVVLESSTDLIPDIQTQPQDAIQETITAAGFPILGGIAWGPAFLVELAFREFNIFKVLGKDAGAGFYEVEQITSVWDELPEGVQKVFAKILPKALKLPVKFIRYKKMVGDEAIDLWSLGLPGITRLKEGDSIHIKTAGEMVLEIVRKKR